MCRPTAPRSFLVKPVHWLKTRVIRNLSDPIVAEHRLISSYNWSVAMEEQEAKQQNPRSLRSIIHFLQGVACTLLVFGLLFTIYLIVIYQIRLTPHVNYAVVFDAGSSHSEMFVYHWPADKSDGLGTTSSVNELFVCALGAVNTSDPNKPDASIVLKAISDFEQNLDLLSDYFRPCLSQAIAKIPADRHKFSPIFLGATAGMRLARLQNLTRSNQVLETIREIFSNSPFQFVISRQVNNSFCLSLSVSRASTWKSLTYDKHVCLSSNHWHVIFRVRKCNVDWSMLFTKDESNRSETGVYFNRFFPSGAHIEWYGRSDRWVDHDKSSVREIQASTCSEETCKANGPFGRTRFRHGRRTRSRWCINTSHLHL